MRPTLLATAIVIILCLAAADRREVKGQTTGTATATITIEAPPILQVMPNALSLKPGGGTAGTGTFTVKLNRPPDAAISIAMDTDSGRPAGARITPSPPTQFTQSTYTSEYTIKTGSGTGTWVITFTASGRISNTGNEASVTITVEAEDEEPATPTVTINDASANEGDALTFTVSLDNAASGGFTVTPNYTDGTATKETDYAENTTAISFTGTANETKTFDVSTTEDTVVEPDETFTVGLTISGASVTITATDTGTARSSMMMWHQS